VSQCGNGARCFALYIQKKNLSYKNTLTVETNAGVLTLNINRNGSVTVDMGAPNFEPSKIPLNFENESSEYLVEEFKVGSLSIGNPHAIVIQDEIKDIEQAASKIQSSDAFPEGVNVGFMQIINREEIKLRVVERGVGETLACGSGACAAVIYGIKSGHLDSKVTVHLNGGDAVVEFDRDRVFLTGPGEFVYEGSINLRSGSS
jgi:diaminopimelate epimerase